MFARLQTFLQNNGKNFKTQIGQHLIALEISTREYISFLLRRHSMIGYVTPLMLLLQRMLTWLFFKRTSSMKSQVLLSWKNIFQFWNKIVLDFCIIVAKKQKKNCLALLLNFLLGFPPSLTKIKYSVDIGTN